MTMNNVNFDFKIKLQENNSGYLKNYYYPNDSAVNKEFIDENDLNKIKNVKIENNDNKMGCKCQKSKCLKLYCECFANEKFCSDCNCLDCHNLVGFADKRIKLVDSIKGKNPNAFKQKLVQSKGCNCSKSFCVKKYCECFQNGIDCTNTCRCLSCGNNKQSSQSNSSNQKKSSEFKIVNTSICLQPMIKLEENAKIIEEFNKSDSKEIRQSSKSLSSDKKLGNKKRKRRSNCSSTSKNLTESAKKRRNDILAIINNKVSSYDPLPTTTPTKTSRNRKKSKDNLMKSSCNLNIKNSSLSLTQIITTAPTSTARLTKVTKEFDKSVAKKLNMNVHNESLFYKPK